MEIMQNPPTTHDPSAPEPLVPVIGEFVAIKPGHCGGKPHIAGHRIKVQHLAVWHDRQGMTAEEIVATYPTLSLPAVYAALAYYYSHHDEIEADIEADERLVAEMKAQASPSKLTALRTAGHGANDSLPPQ